MYEIHELAGQFPEMSDLEFESLVESIRTEGLKEPLLLFEGKVLDGRHRLQACQQLNIVPDVREFNGSRGEAEKLSVAQNLSRRHLNASQKSMLIAMHGMAAKPKADDAESNGMLSIRDAAKRYGVNHMMIYKAFKVLDSDRELAQSVFRGKTSLTKATSIISETTQPKRVHSNRVQRALSKLRQFEKMDLNVSPETADQIDESVDRVIQLLKSVHI